MIMYEWKFGNIRCVIWGSGVLCVGFFFQGGVAGEMCGGVETLNSGCLPKRERSEASG
jgi:hypothetical protein